MLYILVFVSCITLLIWSLFAKNVYEGYVAIFGSNNYEQ